MTSPPTCPVWIGDAGRCASAIGMCLTISAIASQPAHGAGRVPLSGQVSPRCWSAPVTQAPPHDSIDASRSEASPVRCAVTGSQVRVEQRPLAVTRSRTVEGPRDGTRAEAITITVTPTA